jgi:hypothetical protein
MKLAAIYNVWDGVELLKGSMDCLKDHVDLFIIVYQDVSNFGEYYDPLPEIPTEGYNVVIQKYTPKVKAGHENETRKRQLGIDIAKHHSCTHFLTLDCDEYYEDFGKAKQEYINRNLKGSVCKIFTYFKSPKYRLETPDGYYVPFIHELRSDTLTGLGKYPFYVDPTRRINEGDVKEVDCFMHHFSWVRKDIDRKARNSSAKRNIERGTLLNDYYSTKNMTNLSGFYIKDFNKRLILVEDKFGLCEKLKI